MANQAAAVKTKPFSMSLHSFQSSGPSLCGCSQAVGEVETSKAVQGRESHPAFEMSQQIQATSSRVACGCTPVPEPDFWGIHGCPTLIHLRKTTSAVLPIGLTGKLLRKACFLLPPPVANNVTSPSWSQMPNPALLFPSCLGLPTQQPWMPGCAPNNIY